MGERQQKPTNWAAPACDRCGPHDHFAFVPELGPDKVLAYHFKLRGGDDSRRTVRVILRLAGRGSPSHHVS